MDAMDGARLTRFESGPSAVVVDGRRAPLWIVTWIGAPTSELVDEYFGWHHAQVDRARRTGERYALITDALDAGAPSATVRRQIAEQTDRLPDGIEQLQIASFIVIDNALLRGALTALQWLIGGDFQGNYVASIEEAIQRSERALEVAPGSLSGGYRRPESAATRPEA